MVGISSFLFFLHDVVLPGEMLEPTSVPFSIDHGLPLNNNNIQSKPALLLSLFSLPHKDFSSVPIDESRLEVNTLCAVLNNDRG